MRTLSQVLPSTYDRKLFLWVFAISLVFHLVAALVSAGFHHYDEHFQILEFAGLKAGYTTAEALPWEYEAQIRPALQPFLAFSLIKLLRFVGAEDPFLAATILRIVSSLLGWLSSVLTVIAFLPLFDKIWQRRLLVILSGLLWYLFYIHSRFSSETWGGITFFCGLAWLLMLPDKTKFLSVFSIGLLFGLSFLFRFQNALLLPGLFLWLIVFRKASSKQIIVLLAGLLIAMGAGFLVDYWFYGEWVNAPLRYFQVNLQEGKAAEFGTSPWWYYLDEMGFWGGPFIGWLTVVSLILAILFYPKNILVWAIVPFLLAHFVIGHKELRFLFPIANAFPIFIVIALAGLSYWLQRLTSLPEKVNSRKTGRVVVAAFLVLNFILFLSRGLSAHHDLPKPLHYIYDHYTSRDVLLVVHDEYKHDYLPDLRPSFNMRPNVFPVYVYTPEEARAKMAEYPERLPLLLIRSRGFKKPDGWPVENCEAKYHTLPLWLEDYNYNGWSDRTSFWRIYDCESQ